MGARADKIRLNIFMKRQLLTSLTFALLAISSFKAEAVPHRKSLDHKSDQYLSEGVFVGGRSGMGGTLLDLRRSFDKGAQAERIVLDWGDEKGRPLLGKIGFFHVGLDKKNRRAVIDLTQVSQSGLTEEAVVKRLKASPVIKRSQLIFDPFNVSTQLILDFKSDVAVEAFYLLDPKKPARLVLDLRPLKGGAKR